MERSAMLNYLSHLPRKMLSLHDVDAIAELVLHELCSERCFNLNKAVYFIDNPDFNCMKGVAGFSRQEAFKNEEGMWDDHHAFSSYIKNAPFNQKVRSIQRESLQRNHTSDNAMMHALAEECNIDNPQCHTWDMKHHNRGVFIYEKPAVCDFDEYIQNGVCLLSFCSVN